MGINDALSRFYIGTYNTDEKISILANGMVGIGTKTPHETLSVNGNIRAKQIKTETANWPDYVFTPRYSLPTLSNVKAYIDKNQRLPDMPSEKEIATNGQNLGEINKVLVKKVEELTLYLIEKDKQLTEQEQRLDKLGTRLNKLSKANIKPNKRYYILKPLK